MLSGGLDSATCLAIARRAGFECYCLSFDYGQRHVVELEAARRVAESLGAHEHRVVKFDLRQFGGSALTADIEVPKDRAHSDMASAIPVTYVPARNTIFLSFALAYAELTGSESIFIGVNALDYSGYPDCRPEFVEAFERLANLATKAAVEGSAMRVHAPLIQLKKSDIVHEGIRLSGDFAATVSCYTADANGGACGHCDACRLRAQGFSDAGIADPTRYR